MKRYAWLLAMLLGAAAANAQEQRPDTVYWKLAGQAGLALSQVSLTNWAAGGDGSVAFDATFNYGADYRRGRHIWLNRLELAYGLNNTSSEGTRKTNDKIYLSSNYGYRIAEAWFASALVTFNTQFAKGYDYSLTPRRFQSRFMAPGYLLVGAGVTWTPKPWFTATFTPLSWRATFVCDELLSDAGDYGVKPGHTLLSGFGANLQLTFEYEIMKHVALFSRLAFFSDYLHKPLNIDVKWDTQLTMKVNKWISASLSLNLIYDDDVKILQKDGRKVAKVQFKEALGVGFTANF